MKRSTQIDLLGAVAATVILFLSLGLFVQSSPTRAAVFAGVFFVVLQLVAFATGPNVKAIARGVLAVISLIVVGAWARDLVLVTCLGAAFLAWLVASVTAGIFSESQEG